MNAIDQDLAKHIDAELTNATPLGSVEPEMERERIATVHRKGVAKYEQRIADTTKRMKSNLEELEVNRKAELRRHEAEMAAIAEHVETTKALADRDITADERLAASCRAALAQLVRE